MTVIDYRESIKHKWFSLRLYLRNADIINRTKFASTEIERDIEEPIEGTDAVTQ